MRDKRLARAPTEAEMEKTQLFGKTRLIHWCSSSHHLCDYYDAKMREIPMRVHFYPTLSAYLVLIQVGVILAIKPLNTASATRIIAG